MLLLRFIAAAILFNISFSKIIVHKTTFCNIELFFNKFLFKRNHQKCVTIHSHDDSNHIISECVWNYFENNLMMPVYHAEGFTNSLCNLHIIVGTNETFVEIFPPFTKILLINPKAPKKLNVRNMFQKSLNVFAVYMKLTEERIDVLPELYSLVGNKTFDWNTSEEHFLNEKTFIQVLLRNEYGVKELRLSFTDCPPFVITGGPVLDGIEIKIMKELVKNWKIHFFQQSGWASVKSSTIQNRTDVSMCSIWMTEENYKHLDLTNYFDFQCGTFIVKKPTFLNKASYIYKPFQDMVWITFLVNLILTGLLLKVFTILGSKLNKALWSSSKFNSITYSFLEIINTATSHGVYKFPIQIPAKILLTGWMILSLIVGTHYSTGYTSLLASPPTTKPINTIQDFINEEYFWGEIQINQLLEEIKYSTYSEELSKRVRMPTENNRDWLLDRKYGKFVKILSNNNYVAAAEDLASTAGSLRILKECIFRLYASFAVQKNSGLQKIFDNKITQ